MAWPPTGNPVTESRGKRRGGGSGKSERDGVAIWRKDSKPKGAREAETALDGVIGGVLIVKAQEAGAGAEIGIRHAKIGAVEAALGGVGGIVARVAEPC